jgi:hypothetical protein
MGSFRFALRRIAFAGAALFSAFTLQAMSVIAPTFDELVQDAATVFRGTVTDVHAVSVDTLQGPAVRTLVTFHVERVLKGTADADVTLSFLGGKVGRRNLHVLGMPAFAVGQHEIVFVGDNGNAVCPVLAGGHGRYHVRQDGKTRREYVARENDAPVTSTDDVAKPLESAASAPKPASAMSASDFESWIVEAARRNPHRVQP